VKVAIAAYFSNLNCALVLEITEKSMHAVFTFGEQMNSKIVIVVLQFFVAFTAYAQFKSPLVLAHRGASGYRPEHTLESYQLAIEMGADFIEPDLVMTKDKILMARHENEISGTTDVALKFPERKATKTVDGESITGWFIEDFTVKEIKTLRAKERLEFRDQSYNGQFEVPTFAEVLKLVKTESKSRKRLIGVYPELKHPSYFASVKLPLEKVLVQDLKKHGFNKKNSAVYIQSFEMGVLSKLKKLTSLPLIFLIDDPNKIPYDSILAGKKTTYLELIKPESLKELSKTISGIGPYKRYIVPTNDKQEKLAATNLVADAHAAGLLVHAYTFRSEEGYLLKEYKNDPQAEYLEFYKLGVDGVFTDFTDHAIRAKETFLKGEK
jgi:glycerophosphoryl diester phosphodiesterase